MKRMKRRREEEDDDEDKNMTVLVLISGTGQIVSTGHWDEPSHSSLIKFGLIRIRIRYSTLQALSCTHIIEQVLASFSPSSSPTQTAKSYPSLHWYISIPPLTLPLVPAPPVPGLAPIRQVSPVILNHSRLALPQSHTPFPPLKTF